MASAPAKKYDKYDRARREIIALLEQAMNEVEYTGWTAHDLDDLRRAASMVLEDASTAKR